MVVAQRGFVLLDLEPWSDTSDCIKNARQTWGFPGGPKHSPADAGDMGSIPGPGRFHMPRSN